MGLGRILVDYSDGEDYEIYITYLVFVKSRKRHHYEM